MMKQQTSVRRLLCTKVYAYESSVVRRLTYCFIFTCIVSVSTYSVLYLHINAQIPSLIRDVIGNRTYGTTIQNDTSRKIPAITSPYIYIDMPAKNTDDLNKVSVNRSFNTSNYKHKILWWNKPNWMDTTNALKTCVYKNCEITYDRKELTNSSTVIMSIVKNLEKYPPVSRNERNQNQPWIFFTLESPVHTSAIKQMKKPHWQNVFNWSWTYRQDSDIFTPYGKLRKMKKKATIKNYTEIFQKKSKFAAWLVSNCKTQGERETYVKILKRYIQIDIFGTCGKPAPKNIREIISRDYKFYLGFENSLCRDYITEKYFENYNLNVINIVRGGSDYNYFLPNQSFVNTADFTSIKELADFVKRLGSDEKEYIDRLKQKDLYVSTDHSFRIPDVMCSICERLQNLDKYRKSYIDVSNWFGTCKKANDLH